MEVIKTGNGLVIEVDWDEANIMVGGLFRAAMDAQDAAMARELRTGRLSSSDEARLSEAMYRELERAIPDHEG